MFASKLTSKEKTHSIQKGQLIDCLLLTYSTYLSPTHNLFCSLLSVHPIHPTSIRCFPCCMPVYQQSPTHTSTWTRTHTLHPTHTTAPALLLQPAAHGRKGGSMAKATLKPLAKALLSSLQTAPPPVQRRTLNLQPALWIWKELVFFPSIPFSFLKHIMAANFS